MRVRLARVLLDEPSILLLDEPTNHLDVDGYKMLTRLISDFSGTIVMVTHDRSLISESANTIIEITPEKTVDVYSLPYPQFLRARQERYERKLMLYQKEQAEISELEQWLRIHEFHPKYRFSAIVAQKKQTLEKRIAIALPRPIRAYDIG